MKIKLSYIKNRVSVLNYFALNVCETNTLNYRTKSATQCSTNAKTRSIKKEQRLHSLFLKRINLILFNF